MKLERHILLRALAGGLVGVLIALWFVWTGAASFQTRITLTGLIVLPWIGFAFALNGRVAFSLRTLSNLLEALREKDYSLRLRGARRDDAWGELVLEVNALARTLQDQRFGAAETTALLRKTLAQIDVAMFGFDEASRVCLVNDSGRQMLGKSENDILGRSAADLGLADCLDGATPRVMDLALPTGVRRWELRRTTYREKGLSHPLIFLSDLTRTLHQEERLAWKRLIQILRHEINNSLTPIQSVAQTLRARVAHDGPDAWQDDVREGLEIIASRSEELSRFIASYSKLTRLPDPVFATVDIPAWVQHVTSLEKRVRISVRSGPDMNIEADRGQLDQLLINLVANAAEASLEAKPNANGRVEVRWHVEEDLFYLWVDDDGPGFDPAKDPFVPFYTTKPTGSGIGLALGRQIAEVHGGYLTLEPHPNHPGSRACLRLPIRQTPAWTP